VKKRKSAKMTVDGGKSDEDGAGDEDGREEVMKMGGRR